MKKVVILTIEAYRYFISPFLGKNCRFYPSCSLYAKLAVEQHGVFCGVWLILRRILKCHPWYTGEWYDPVPEKRKEIGPTRDKKFYDR